MLSQYDLDRFKVNEMMQASQPPGVAPGTLGALTVQPVFKDQNGNPVGSVQVGQAYTFEVPGYTHVWLILTKDGQQTYNGPFDVPMPPYTAVDYDIGKYVATVYDPDNGAPIGAAAFQVVAKGASPSATGGLSTTWLLAGAAALYFFMRKR